MSARYHDATASIAINESLSGVVFLGRKSLVHIQMPAGWDTADLSFQTSPDGLTFTDLYIGGSEYTEPAAASRSISPSPSAIQARYLKLRSGTTGVPVTQTAARSIILGLKGDA